MIPAHDGRRVRPCPFRHGIRISAITHHISQTEDSFIAARGIPGTPVGGRAGRSPPRPCRTQGFHPVERRQQRALGLVFKTFGPHLAVEVRRHDPGGAVEGGVQARELGPPPERPQGVRAVRGVGEIVRAGLQDGVDGVVTEAGLDQGRSQALPEEIDGVIVCLGDMPLVTGRDLDRLIAAFNPLEGRAIIVPTRHGKRGNPVLWDRRFFAEMTKVSGDTGAKHLIGEHADLVCEVEMTGEAAITDIDTPEALAAWRARSVS